MVSLRGDKHLSAKEKGPTLPGFPGSRSMKPAHRPRRWPWPNSGPLTPGGPALTSLPEENTALFEGTPNPTMTTCWVCRGPETSLGLHSEHRQNTAQRPPEPPATGQKLSTAGSMSFLPARTKLTPPLFLFYFFFKAHWHTSTVFQPPRGLLQAHIGWTMHARWTSNIPTCTSSLHPYICVSIQITSPLCHDCLHFSFLQEGGGNPAHLLCFEVGFQQHNSSVLNLPPRCVMPIHLHCHKPCE